MITFRPLRLEGLKRRGRLLPTFPGKVQAKQAASVDYLIRKYVRF